MGKIEIVSGTNRPGSNSLRIVKLVAEMYRKLDCSVDVIDLQDMPSDVFTGTAYTQTPASFQPFIDRVLQASGIVFVVPEYNGGPPGILKYFIDLLPFPEALKDRPVCFIGLGAGDWGGVRPVEHMQQICGYRYAHILPYRVFVRGIHSCFDKEGAFTNEDYIKRLEEQSSKFCEFVSQVGEGGA